MRTVTLLVAVAAVTAITTVAAMAGSSQFSDVDAGATHEDGIGFMAETGVTAGCAPGFFCPQDDVTREQMATFMHRLSGQADGVDPSVDAATLQGMTVQDIQDGIEAPENDDDGEDDAPEDQWAFVDGSDGTLIRGSGVDDSSGGGNVAGRYTVTFDDPVDECSYQATSTPSPTKGVYIAGVAPGGSDRSVDVTVVDDGTGDFANADFHLHVVC